MTASPADLSARLVAALDEHAGNLAPAGAVMVTVHLDLLGPGEGPYTTDVSVERQTRTLAFLFGKVLDASGAVAMSGTGVWRLRTAHR